MFRPPSFVLRAAACGVVLGLFGCSGMGGACRLQDCPVEADLLRSCDSASCSLSSGRTFDGAIEVGETLNIVTTARLSGVFHLEVHPATVSDLAIELQVNGECTVCPA